MRLLNTSSFELKEIFDKIIPGYAILSHRWEEDEVSYQDIVRGVAQEKQGWRKIMACCEIARKGRCAWLWHSSFHVPWINHRVMPAHCHSCPPSNPFADDWEVDTCCIDKSSSAELSESINSMYRWYKDARICYVYLYDVISGDVEADTDFAQSEWWRRGWTLQELLAPMHISFYNSSWSYLGDKLLLSEQIASISGINEIALKWPGSLTQFSVAQRMSWASKRTTTREEDMAYCLLGIFQINMPLLYGEGQRAFLRLQEEIMKQSDDHSIFAWTQRDDFVSGPLALYPAYFEDCSEVVVSSTPLKRSPYAMTNMGLSIELPMIAWEMETYLAFLDCKDADGSHIGIFLRLDRQTKTNHCNRFGRRRLCSSSLVEKSHYRSIYIRQRELVYYQDSNRNLYRLFFDEDSDRGLYSLFFDEVSDIYFYGFWLRELPISGKFKLKGATIEHKLCEVQSRTEWNPSTRLLEIPQGSQGTAGVLWWKSTVGYSALKLGFDDNFHPVCQFMGPLWGPISRTSSLIYPESSDLERQMNNSWISDTESVTTGWRYTGERITGLFGSRHTHEIQIRKGDLGEGRFGWAVDVKRVSDESLT